MNRKQAKELLPIIQAFVAGEAIEVRNKSKYEPGEWIETTIPSFDIVSHEYRIKPKPKYRPFANAEECWQEMLKHQPFGWVIRNNVREIIVAESPFSGVVLQNQSGSYYDFEEANRILTFADGTPFGIKEE